MTPARARPPLYPVLVAPLWAITRWSSASPGSVGVGELIVQLLLGAGVGGAALLAAARLVGPDRGARAAMLVAVALLWPLPELVALCVLALAGVLLARGPGSPSTSADRTAASFATGLAATLIASAAVAALHWRPSEPPAEPIALTGPDRPDIWWILLDGHARADWLKERFQLDEGLSEDLAERGFIVADDARANYVQTLYSVLATLNVDYVDATLGGEATRARVAAAMRDTRVARSLREAGYRTVFWPGGCSQLEPAFDESAGPWPIPSEYHLVLLSRSLPLALAERASGHSLARSWRAWFVSAQLAAVRPETGGAPAFHLVHVLSPHPPFFASGEGRGETIADASHWERWNAGSDYREGYARQVEWLRPQVRAAVDRLLAGRPAVILISSDHGSGFGLDWDDPRGEPLADRLAILWALHLPKPPRRAPPRDISLVNTFRVVLREALGADLRLVRDRSYAQRWPDPERMWEFGREDYVR